MWYTRVKLPVDSALGADVSPAGAAARAHRALS